MFDFAEVNRNNMVEGSNFYKPKVNTASGRTKVSKTLPSNLINTVIGASVIFSEQFRRICAILLSPTRFGEITYARVLLHSTSRHRGCNFKQVFQYLCHYCGQITFISAPHDLNHCLCHQTEEKHFKVNHNALILLPVCIRV